MKPTLTQSLACELLFCRLEAGHSFPFSLDRFLKLCKPNGRPPDHRAFDDSLWRRIGLAFQALAGAGARCKVPLSRKTTEAARASPTQIKNLRR